MSDYDRMLAQVEVLLQPYLKPGQNLTENAELVADLGLNSMQIMELLQEIEDHFDISIPLNILPEVRTVGELTQRLQTLAEPSPDPLP